MEIVPILEKTFEIWYTLLLYSCIPLDYVYGNATQYLSNVLGGIGAALVVFASYKHADTKYDTTIRRIFSWASLVMLIGLALGTMQNGPIVALATILLVPAFILTFSLMVIAGVWPIAIPYVIFKVGMRWLFELITYNWISILTSIIVAISGFLYIRTNFEEELGMAYNILMIGVGIWLVTSSVSYRADVDRRIFSKRNTTVTGAFKSRDLLESEAEEEIDQEMSQR